MTETFYLLVRAIAACLHVPSVSEVVMLERKCTLVGQVAGRSREILIITAPRFIIGQCLHGLGICHPSQRLGHGDEPHVVPRRRMDTSIYLTNITAILNTF